LFLLRPWCALARILHLARVQRREIRAPLEIVPSLLPSQLCFPHFGLPFPILVLVSCLPVLALGGDA
jgi:hypothetical protein